MTARFLQVLLSHRTLALARWDLALLRSRIANLLSLQSARIATDLRQRPSPLYLNLGCGPKGRHTPHWFNIDAVKTRGVDYAMDFTRHLPLPSDCFDGLFCEHVVEHFSDMEIPLILGEIHRIIKPGASIRIIVPDGRWILDSYINNPAALLNRRLGAGSSGTAMQAVNSFFRQRYEHQFIYDYETLELLLLRAGFSHVQKSSYGRSQLQSDLVLDDPGYAPESLYVEAVK